MGRLPELSASLRRILTGWFTAEVGRQPWTVYGVLRTAEAGNADADNAEAIASLAFFVCVHGLIFSFGTYYIYRLLKAGPKRDAADPNQPETAH